MAVKLAPNTCFQSSRPIIPHSPSSSYQTLASATSSSPSSIRRSASDLPGPLFCRYLHRLHRSALFRTPSPHISTSQSYEYTNSRPPSVKRACSASLDAFSDEDFSKKIQELALRFQLSDDHSSSSNPVDPESETVSDSGDNHGVNSSDSYNSINKESSDKTQNHRQFPLDSSKPPCPEIRQEPPDWLDDIVPASIERKANSIDIPLSLRIIKRKIQWQEGSREAGETAYCSVKMAFSSMVFIIRELHSYTLLMRELLFTEDLQGILVRVQKEMHASFVWLFQQVFSHTPTLMMYVMILLANFTVYSMGGNTAVAASVLPPGTCAATTESVSAVQDQDQKNPKFDSLSLKTTFSVSSSSGKSSSIGSNNGGGGKFRPVANGTDGEGWFEQSDKLRRIVPDGALSQLSSLGRARETEERLSRKEESGLWNSIVEEASEMREESSVAVDEETMQRLVSPIRVKIEADDDYADYFRTELLYQTGLSQDPNNSLLLANYAQFLYLVNHDYDRAEEYFKRAIGVEEADAEAYSKYATFLWRLRKDKWAAEETFLEAISEDPTNSYYPANYAHFLWSTGGEDSCYPIN